MSEFDQFPKVQSGFEQFPRVSQEPAREIGRLEAGLLGAAQGLTARFSDEFEGGVRALFAKAAGDDRPFSEIFGEEKGKVTALLEEARRQQPEAFAVGDIGGAIAGVGKLLGGGLTSKAAQSALPRAVRVPATGAAAATEGAGIGAAFEAGQAEGGLEERARAAQEGAELGALFGVGGQALGRGIQTAIEGFRGFRNVPQLDDLRQAAQSAFNAAENAGVTIRDAAYRQFANQAARVLPQRGLDRDITPNAFRALQRAQEIVGSNPSFRQLMTLREVFRGATEAAKAGSKDRKLSEDLVRGLDEFIERQTPRTVTGGDPQLAAAAYQEARGLWRRLRKAEVIDELFESARLGRSQFSASGFENALRVQFRQLARNKKRMRGFTPVEQRAIREVAAGGPVANIARFIGRFAPTGPVSGIVTGGATVVNPALGASMAAASLAGRGAATAARMRDARRVEALVRGGEAVSPVSAQIGQLLGRGAIAGGGPALMTMP